MAKHPVRQTGDDPDDPESWAVAPKPAETEKVNPPKKRKR